jgi:hypothetical protein
MRKKNLAEVLQTDVTTNLPVAALAQIVRSKGRGRDTVLAHITPREARKLKREGGRGSINPDTGLPEFEDGYFDFFSGPTDYGSFVEPAAGEFTPYQSNEPQYIYNEPAGPAYEPSATGGATLGYYDPQDFGAYPQQGDLATAYSTLATDPTMAGGYIPTTMQASFPRQDMTDIAALPVARPSFLDTTAAAEGGEPALAEGAAGQDELSKRVAELEKAKETASPAQKSFLDKLTADPLKLALLLGAGGLGAYTSAAARKQAGDVSGQIKALAQEQRTMAQPFLQQGGLQYGLATQGGLTPVNQQQFDVARARLAQEAARTGSVGAMQATQIAEQMRQQAINNQLTQALQILGSGNTVMNSAIANEINALNTRVNLTNQANTAAGNFFTQLAQLYGGSRA